LITQVITQDAELRMIWERAADLGAALFAEVTLQELCRENADLHIYNTAGVSGATLGDFVLGLDADWRTRTR
jgi:hypothetical protein